MASGNMGVKVRASALSFIEEEIVRNFPECNTSFPEVPSVVSSISHVSEENMFQIVVFIYKINDFFFCEIGSLLAP